MRMLSMNNSSKIRSELHYQATKTCNETEKRSTSTKEVTPLRPRNVESQHDIFPVFICLNCKGQTTEQKLELTFFWEGLHTGRWVCLHTGGLDLFRRHFYNWRFLYIHNRRIIPWSPVVVHPHKVIIYNVRAIIGSIFWAR